MATHSSIFAWTEDTAGLQFMGSQRVGHDWATNTHTLVWNFGPSLARTISYSPSTPNIWMITKVKWMNESSSWARAINCLWENLAKKKKKNPAEQNLHFKHTQNREWVFSPIPPLPPSQHRISDDPATPWVLTCQISCLVFKTLPNYHRYNNQHYWKCSVYHALCWMLSTNLFTPYHNPWNSVVDERWLQILWYSSHWEVGVFVPLRLIGMWLFWPIQCTGNDVMNFSISHLALGKLAVREEVWVPRELSCREETQAGHRKWSRESHQLLHPSQPRCQTSKWRHYLAYSTPWSLHLTPAPAGVWPWLRENAHAGLLSRSQWSHKTVRGNNKLMC